MADEASSTDEGLKEDGTLMSQIPTYVTAVPNGTEKVTAWYLAAMTSTDVFQGFVPGRRSWRYQFSRLLHISARKYTLHSQAVLGTHTS